MTREAIVAEIEKIDAKIVSLQEKRNELENRKKEFDKEDLYRKVEKKKITAEQLNAMLALSEAEIKEILTRKQAEMKAEKQERDNNLPGQMNMNEEGEVI